MIRVGVIGFGYWGPNVARNFNSCPGAKVTAVCDMKPNRLSLAESLYPSVKTFSNPGDLIRSRSVDVVAVVTPVYTHYALARKALNHGKHVFVEKPFTATTAQAEKLVELAARKNLKIMVDHTFLFTGAVRKMRELIEAGELGKLFFYDSVRVNLGLFQHDVNVVWDLAPHDLSIMSYLIKEKPVAVSAHGGVHFQGELEDIAYVTVHFENPNFIAHFHVNWLSPVKVRRTLISGDRKMLLWDDLSADEKVKVYDRGVAMNGKNGQNGVEKILVSYRTGDVHIPRLDGTEALKREVEYLVGCLERNEEPLNDGRAGLEVVRILEAADRSLRKGGRRIEL